MISKIVCTSAEGGGKYFAQHLSQGDYFVQKESQGEFIGRVAKRNGVLEQAPTAESFGAFMSSDMKYFGATSTRQRASEIKYIEFTYSAPKSVSVAAALDPRVKAELYAAVKEEMQWFEGNAAVRDRRGVLANSEVTVPTKEIFGALFQHETSRTNDPDFHVHGLISNVTWDEQRQGYFALHYGQMLEYRKTLDARIHNNLAARMAKLGYQVEAAPSGFGLKEISKDIELLFSERAQQVKIVKEAFQLGYSPQQVKTALNVADAEKRSLLQSLETLTSKMGMPSGKIKLTPRQADENAVLLTRPPKVKITSETLTQDVKDRLKENGFAVKVPSPGWAVKNSLDLDQAIDQGVSAVFERTSVARLDQLVGEIVRLAPGAISNEQLAEQLRNDEKFLLRRKDGKEYVTTHKILGEERALLQEVADGMSSVKPLTDKYQVPKHLQITQQRIEQLLFDARNRGEELTATQARTWLQQFSAIHEYALTSTDRFVNIRGGAGVGKTFCMENLVGESLQAGRQVVLCAPYGEQSRVTLRAEADRLAQEGKQAVADTFRQANTVDHLLIRAQNDSEFLSSLHGADIYVDEAGLLDTPKALELVKLAKAVDGRVIFQGDTEQMAAVGRGQPIKLLQEELGLGMATERASISRRQLKTEDKQLAADLSSGDDVKFLSALERMGERGMIEEIGPDQAIERVAREMVESKLAGKDMVAVSSVHRISERLSDRVHELYVEKTGLKDLAKLEVHLKRDLQTAELKSTRFYERGQLVEYEAGAVKKKSTILEVEEDKIRVGTPEKSSWIDRKKISALYEKKTIERGKGETVILQEKIKQGSKTFEKGSRQVISHLGKDGTVHFKSGLKISTDDGRIRQGDCLTDYKSQGIKGASVRGIEDINSSLAMGKKEAFHVKATRHVENLKIYIEDKGVFMDAVQRSGRKVSALELSRMQAPQHRKVTAPKMEKKELLARAQAWGKDFVQKVRRDRAQAQEKLIKSIEDRKNIPSPQLGKMLNQSRLTQKAPKRVVPAPSPRLQVIARPEPVIRAKKLPTSFMFSPNLVSMVVRTIGSSINQAMNQAQESIRAAVRQYEATRRQRQAAQQEQQRQSRKL